MFELGVQKDHLDWEAIEPHISRLYDRYLAPELITWSEEIWMRLRTLGLTRADSELDTLDSFTRAVSLFDLHRMVVYYLGNVDLDMGMDGSLISFARKSDLKELAVVRYGLAYENTLQMDESVSAAIGTLYMHQVPAAIRALYRSYGSPPRMHQRILELSILPRKPAHHPSNANAGAAIQYIQRIARSGVASSRVATAASSRTIH